MSNDIKIDKGEYNELLELALDIDTHSKHAKFCDPTHKGCTCGLSVLRKRLNIIEERENRETNIRNANLEGRSESTPSETHRSTRPGRRGGIAKASQRVAKEN